MSDIVDTSISQISDSNCLPENLIEILNYLLNCLRNDKLKSINELSNITIIQAILSEMDPSFKFDFNESDSFGIQYSNYLEILKSIEKYIKTNCENDKLTSKANITESINVNLVLKENLPTLVSMARILLFLSSISPNKDVFVEKISNIKIHLLIIYFACMDEFIQIDSNDSVVKSSTMLLNKSALYKDRKMEEYDSIILDLENNINQLKNKIEALDKENLDWEVKYTSKCREIEIMKKNNERSLNIQEQMLQVTLRNAELLSEVNQKNIYIEQLKESMETKESKNTYERHSFQSEKSILESKLEDYNGLKDQYFRLSNKYKELAQSKEKSELEALATTIEQKDKQIELFSKEKNTLISKIEKISIENSSLLESYSKIKKLCLEYQEELKEKQKYSDCDIVQIPLQQASNMCCSENTFTIDCNLTLKKMEDEEKLKELEAKAGILFQEKEELITELKKTNEINKDTQHLMSVKEEELILSRGLTQKKTEENTNLNNQIELLQNDLNKLKEEKVNEATQSKSTIDKIKLELNTLKDINSQLTNQKAQLETVLTKKDTHIDLLKLIKEKDAQIQEMINERNQLKDNQLGTESQIKEKNDMINNLLQTINILKESSNNLSIELKNKVELLIVENDNMKKEIAKYEEEIENKNKEIKIMEIGADLHKSTTETIPREEKEKYEKEIISLQEDVKLKKEEIQKFEKLIAMHTANTKELEKKISILNSQQSAQSMNTQNVKEQIPGLNLETNSIISESLYTFAYRLLNG